MSPSTTPTVVAICGSLRPESKTRTALEQTLSVASATGGETELLDLREYDLPALDTSTDTPPAANRISATVERADSLLLGTPTYHGSYSGALKNALDYCGRDEFAGTTVGLLEVAGGRFPGGACDHLRTVSRTLNAWTLPLEVAIPHASDLVVDGEITDDDLRSRIEQLGRELVEYAGVDNYPEAAAVPTDPV